MLRHMTRENKLALVVGFGLILLVGILISDHFSRARSQESAELTHAVDPLGPARSDEADLLALRTGISEPRRTVPVYPEAFRSHGEGGVRSSVRPVDPVVPGRSVPVEMGGRREREEPGVGLSPTDAAGLPFRYHHIRADESLTEIARRYYGDVSMVTELAAANGIENPDLVQAGMRLRIPGGNDLVRGRDAAAPPLPGPAPAGETTRSAGTSGNYVVKDGDNLSEIAQKLLGSGRRWMRIYETNRDLLDSPDDLQPGMKLKIPAGT